VAGGVRIDSGKLYNFDFAILEGHIGGGLPLSFFQLNFISEHNVKADNLRSKQ
jgi:hypothetical protein